MKTLQGFETIEIEADSEGVTIRQYQNNSDEAEAVWIPAHAVRAFIKSLCGEWSSIESAPEPGL